MGDVVLDTDAAQATLEERGVLQLRRSDPDLIAPPVESFEAGDVFLTLKLGFHVHDQELRTVLGGTL